MKHETERSYVDHYGQWDNPRAWDSGAMYFVGQSDRHELGDAEAVMSTTPSGNSTSWADAFKSAIPTLAAVYQQRQLTKLNLARINRNQPPITAREYAEVYQPPAAQVQVGATSDTKKLMLYAAIGVAALVGLRVARVI